MNGLQLALGTVMAALIGLLAYQAGALSASGAWAAWLVGSLTFGFGGLLPALLLVAFFLSSSLLSRVGGARKQELAEKFAKGSTRDAAQVAANGAVASVCAVLAGLGVSELMLAGVLGALAAVTADTWATELGVLARSQPRRLTDWSRVAPGTSGAVTLEGSMAAGGGALFIGGLASLFTGQSVYLLAGLLGGAGGAFFDSLLGASLQARYLCPQCGKETEHHPRHTCGSQTQFSGGWRWLNNDAVNALASFVGACLGVLVAWLSL